MIFIYLYIVVKQKNKLFFKKNFNFDELFLGSVDKYWGTETKTKKTIFRLSESANIKIPKCIMLGMDAIIVLLLNN